MVNNPLYPGYMPKKKEDGSLNPLYPGYYSGEPRYKRPKKPELQPMEYDFDNFSNELDEIGKEIASTPVISPKWYVDRTIDDWKNQLKLNVAVSPQVKLDVTELDDYATDDLAGATTQLSLNIKDWGIGNEKGIEQTKKQLKSTLQSWVKETTGIDLNNILNSDFSDIQNSLNEKLWNRALGYGDEDSNTTEGRGAAAIADRTGAMFENVRKSAYTDNQGIKLSPLDLKHGRIRNPDGTTSLFEDRIYETTVSAASNFAKNRDNVRYRDSTHTKFLTEAFTAVKKDVSQNLKTGSLSSKQNTAINFFNTEVEILNNMEAVQDIASNISKELIKRTQTQRISWRDPNWDVKIFIDDAARKLDQARRDIIKLRSSLSTSLPQDRIDFIDREIRRYDAHIENLLEITDRSKKNNYTFSRNDLKRLSGRTPNTNFSSRTTFQDSLGGNLRRDMERSMLGNKDSDIGSVINADGVDLRAKKLAPTMYRLRQDRIHYAAKEVLTQFDKGGLAQVAETYIWKGIKNRMSDRLERATSGSIIENSLKRSNYLGLKIDDMGTPTDIYFNDHPRKKAAFERKFLNKTDVTLDKKLVGLVGEGGSNKIRVTSADVNKDSLDNLVNLNNERRKKGLAEKEIASLALIGDKNLRRFKFDKSKSDQILLARLINNDRSNDALEQLSQKMFGLSFSELGGEQIKEMEGFFTKIKYSNNWVSQKSQGKIKTLQMQKGFLDLTDRSFLNTVGMNEETIKKLLGSTGLYINKGQHLDVFVNNRVLGFLNSNATDIDKQKFLDHMLFARGNNQIWTQKIFGRNQMAMSASEIIEWNGIQDQFNKFSKWVESQRHILGSNVDTPAFRIQMFLQIKKQGISGFSAVNVNEDNEAFLLLKNIFEKNERLNKGYQLNEKRYLGRLEKINNKMQSLQKAWNKSPLGKLIKFIKNWQEILSEKIIALLSKLIAKLAGITAASLGPLATLLPIIQAVAEKVVKKALDYGSAFIKAIFKLDFDDFDKMLQQDFKKILQGCFLVTACSSLLLLPIILFFAALVSTISPIDNTRLNYDGYGKPPTSGAPDKRMFSCENNICGGKGVCEKRYNSNDLVTDPGIGGFYYNQRDSRWKDLPMNGNPGITIGNYGCAITSIAMIYTYFGVTYTPAQIEAGEDGVGRFYGNTAYFLTAEVSIANYELVEPSDEGLKKFFETHPGGIMMVEIGVNDPANPTQHWVVLTDYSYEKNDFVLYDPWTGPDACLKQQYSGRNVTRAYGYYQNAGQTTCTPKKEGEGGTYDLNCNNYVKDNLCYNIPIGTTSSDKSAYLALRIACGLKPGFRCAYNYPDTGIMSPLHYYSGNVISARGEGSILWDQDVYNDFIAGRISERELHNYGLALYWCTWLPIKVYNTIYGQKFGSNWVEAEGGKMPLGAANMCSDETFDKLDIERKEPFIRFAKRGDLVCFKHGGIINHVGVIYEKNQDYITVIESNSGYIINYYSTISQNDKRVDQVSHFGHFRYQ